MPTQTLTHADSVVQTIDRRRKLDRDVRELLVERSRWLAPSDRALFQAVFRDGLTAAQAARIARVSPRAVRSQLHTLARHLMDPKVVWAARRLRKWGPVRAQVARAVILQKRTHREAGRLLRMSSYRLRGQLALIEELWRQHQDAAVRRAG